MAERPNNFFAENIFTRPPITPIGGTGGGIEIPGIRVGTYKGEVMGTLEFYQTDTWKSLNPRLFLFTPKRRRRIRHAPGEPGYKAARPSRMVHPTHLAGSNVKWWGGINRFPSGAIILRHTEFVLPTTTPYSWFNLNNMGLDPYEWCTAGIGDDSRQTVAGDFPINTEMIGKKYRIGKPSRDDWAIPLYIDFSSQKKKFKFAIVIDNPNATVDSPYLMGPMSDSIVLRFIKEPGTTGPESMFYLGFTPDHISRVIS